MKFFKNRDAGAVFLILEGIVYTTVFNLYNPFIQMFGKRMGAEDIHIALLNAAPPLVAMFVLIPFGILIERINRKKQTVMLLLFIYSFFYAAIAFVPAIPHRSKVIIYVILIGLMNGPGSLYLTTWQSYFADNFSGSYANRIYTLRSKYSALFGLLTVLVTGLLLTNIPGSDEERLFLYQIFYGICFALTLLQLFFFSRVTGRCDAGHGALPAGSGFRMESGARVGSVGGKNAGAGKDSRVKSTGRVKNGYRAGKSGSGCGLRQDLILMLADKPFLIFCLCGFVFHLTWQMGWPLFFIYNADYAGLNEFQLSLISVAAGLSQFISYTAWDKLIDKKGSSLAIIFGAAGLAVNPLFFITLQSFPVIFAVNLFSGVFVAGFALALFSGLLEVLPSDKKTIYISVFNTLTNITGFIAPLIGIKIYNITDIYTAMLIFGVLRLFATLLYVIRRRFFRKNPAGGQAPVEIPEIKLSEKATRE